MRLRFFLSSPGDVADERTFAQQVIEQELPKDPFVRGLVDCEAVRWDDPLSPTKVEELVASLGAKVVDYTTKMQCCGGALDRVGEREGSLAFCRRKLYDVQGEGADVEPVA